MVILLPCVELVTSTLYSKLGGTPVCFTSQPQNRLQPCSLLGVQFDLLIYLRLMLEIRFIINFFNLFFPLHHYRHFSPTLCLLFTYFPYISVHFISDKDLTFERLSQSSTRFCLTVAKATLFIPLNGN